MMAEYKNAVMKDMAITEQDERVKAEMFTFIYNEKMKEEAQA